MKSEKSEQIVTLLTIECRKTKLPLYFGRIELLHEIIWLAMTMRSIFIHISKTFLQILAPAVTQDHTTVLPCDCLPVHGYMDENDHVVYFENEQLS